MNNPVVKALASFFPGSSKRGFINAPEYGHRMRDSLNPQCTALVGIPPEDDIHAVILLGYPDVTYQRPAPKPEKPIHWV